MLVWLAGVGVVDARARGACIATSLGCALVATTFEIALTSTGAFSYGRPDVFGVAMWLPGIYLNAGLAAHLVDRRLLLPLHPDPGTRTQPPALLRSAP